MIKILKKRPFLILLILGLILRLGLLFLDYSWDVNNHMIWGKDLISRGPLAFYDIPSSQIFASRYPNYPPLAIFIFSLIYPLNALIFKIAWFLNTHIQIFPSKIIFFIQSDTFLAGLFKLPAILADLGTASLIYLIAKKLFPKNLKSNKLIAILFLFNPAIFYNSAYWGQIDMIPIFFVILAVYFLFFTRYVLFGGISFLLALLIKPTALIFLPVYLFYLIKKSGYPKTAGVIVISNILFWFSFLPFMINPHDLTYPYGIYNFKILAAQSLPYVTNGAFNFWVLVTGIGGIKDIAPFIFGVSYRFWSYAIVGILFLIIIYRSRKSKDQLFSLFNISFLTAFAVFLFLTKMHERYFILVLPFLLLACLKNSSLIKWYLILSLISFLNLYHSWPVPFGKYFYPVIDNMILIKILSLTSIIIFFYLLYRFLSLKKSAAENLIK